MTDKRQKDTKVKCKRDESQTKQSIFVNIVFSRGRIWVLLELIHRWTQHFSKTDQEKRKQIYIWNPMTTGFIMLTLIYEISMEFPSLSTRRSSSRNVPQWRWARRNVCLSQATIKGPSMRKGKRAEHRGILETFMYGVVSNFLKYNKLQTEYLSCEDFKWNTLSAIFLKM